MADFEYPDFDPAATPAPLSPNVPLNPPMVGQGSPFVPVDGQNRDEILASIRAWVYRSLLPWTTNWQNNLVAYQTALNTWLDGLDEALSTYITEHAVAGYSIRSTATPIAQEGTTNVTFTGVDETYRPVIVGDIAVDETDQSNYGIVTVVLSPTTATVQYINTLAGPQGAPGLSFWATATPIAGEGTTEVEIAGVEGRALQLNDLVVDTTADSNFGTITTLVDATHATVTYLGTFKGAQGEQGIQGNPGTNGTDGIMASVVAGNNVFVDSTDPANPIVSAIGNFIFTNPATMNATVHGGGGGALPDIGSVGVLVGTGTDPDDLIVSTWVCQGDEWGSPTFYVPHHNIANWAETVTWLDLGANTNLNMINGELVEGDGSSRAFWNPRTAMFEQDYDRRLTPGPTEMPASPSGSATKNPDQSVSLVNCSSFTAIFATAPETDGTDVWLMHLFGEMTSNGHALIQLANADGPDSSAGYFEFGHTQQLSGDDDTNEGDTTPGGQWVIVSDTTGNPKFLDAFVTLSHLASSVLPVIGEIESWFYDHVEVTVAYKRQINVFNQSRLGYTGVTISFPEEPFTGTFQVKRVF